MSFHLVYVRTNSQEIKEIIEKPLNFNNSINLNRFKHEKNKVMSIAFNIKSLVFKIFSIILCLAVF